MDVLAAGPDFETRVAALEATFMAADDLFAARIARNLNALSLSGQYRAMADNLAAEIGTRGAEALYDPVSVWGSGQGGQVPDTELRSLSVAVGGPLGARLLMAADGGASTVSDGVIQALIDLADDWQGDEEYLAELQAPMREVAFSPRRMLGRIVSDIVDVGDDLRSVALRLYGDPERWADVIVTYNLQPPYVSRTPRAGCLSPGMALVTGQSRIPDAEIGAMGETMKLVAIAEGPQQQWDIVPAPQGGIQTVSGALCLATDCALRLTTPLGDLPEDPTYGMPEIPGLPRNEASAAQYMLAAETLKYDSRVGSVAASARPGGLTLFADVVVVPASSENIRYE